MDATTWGDRWTVLVVSVLAWDMDALFRWPGRREAPGVRTGPRSWSACQAVWQLDFGVTLRPVGTESFDGFHCGARPLGATWKGEVDGVVPKERCLRLVEWHVD